MCTKCANSNETHNEKCNCGWCVPDFQTEAEIREEAKAKWKEYCDRAVQFGHENAFLYDLLYEIDKWWLSKLSLQKQQMRESLLSDLSYWIDEHIGISSGAIYMYMAKGIIPAPFQAPSDEGDRNRCAVLLKAVPEWIERLCEIESLHIEGTRNGEKVQPWNEQIPLILSHPLLK